MGNSIDPTTGRLLFSNAPQTVADFQALADRIDDNETPSVTNIAALADVPRKRYGMLRVAADTGIPYMYYGSTTGWLPFYRSVGGLITVTGDVNGVASVNHGLGRKPQAGGAWIADDTPTIADRLKVNTFELTATQVRVRFYRLDSPIGTYAVNDVKIYWSAVG